MNRWLKVLAAGAVTLTMWPAMGSAQDAGQGQRLRKRDGSCLVAAGATDQTAAGQRQQIRQRKRDGTGPGCVYGLYGLPQCWWFMGSATADQNATAQQLQKRDGTGPGYGWSRGGGGGRGWRGGRGAGTGD